MIDTVPAHIKFTEVIQPLKVKPTAISLWWMGDGNIELRGEVRVSRLFCMYNYKTPNDIALVLGHERKSPAPHRGVLEGEGWSHTPDVFYDTNTWFHPIDHPIPS